MKWGLIARVESNRGLGIQTYEMYRHLHPDRVLVVHVTDERTQKAPNIYTGNVLHVDLDHKRGLAHEKKAIQDWMQGLDAVVSVETLYGNWDIAEWGRKMGVKTIVHCNPEFQIQAKEASIPSPDVWWYPTSWKPIKELAPGELVPVPIPDGIEFVSADPYDGGPLKILYLGGVRALQNRNGSDAVAQVIPKLRSPAIFTGYFQDGGNFGPSRHNPNVKVEIRGEVLDRWEPYYDHHLLLMPRKYGGLCLPALEAMASGLAVAMTNVSPNSDWPIIPINSARGPILNSQAGRIQTYTAGPIELQRALTEVATKRNVLADYHRRSREWAEENTWSKLAPLYYDKIEAACQGSSL